MLLPLLVAANLATMIGMFTLGRFHTDPAALLNYLGSRLLDSEQTGNPKVAHVVWDIRFPRMVAALPVDDILSITGAAYQSLFRNPLVSPDILGVSGGTGFGAVLVAMLGLGPAGLQGVALLFGLLVVLGAWDASRMTRRDQVLALVLGGITVSALFFTGVSILKYLADPDRELPAITFWLMGGLDKVRHMDLPALFAPILTCTIVLWLPRWQLDAMTFGEETAKSLGTNATWFRVEVIMCTTILTAVSVSIPGVIGQVRLIVSHMTRILFGPQHRLLIPVPFLLGSLFLIGVDTISRTLLDAEIPLGILTALPGAPFLAWLIMGNRSWRIR